MVSGLNGCLFLLLKQKSEEETKKRHKTPDDTVSTMEQFVNLLIN